MEMMVNLYDYDVYTHNYDGHIVNSRCMRAAAAWTATRLSSHGGIGVAKASTSWSAAR